MNDSLLSSFMKQMDFNDALNEMMALVSYNLSLIKWPEVFRVCTFFLVALFMLTLVLFVNDLAFSNFRKNRMRRHQLTITNEGNTPSIFLFHPVELPVNVAIYFLVEESPMIYVMHKKKKEELRSARAEQTEQQQTEESEQPEKKEKGAGGLIPDLNNPNIDVRETVNKEANKVRKNAGLFASILSGISSLLPGKNKLLEEGASKLKGVQQDISDTTASLNTKVNSVDLLKDQVGSLSDEVKLKDSRGKTSDSGKKNVSEDTDHENVKVPEFLESMDLVYDEEFWKQADKNKPASEIGENYAQSRILKPGESMRIDLELRNLSNKSEAVTHMYKIEVLQLPQTNLILSAPRQYINGIVTFPKIPVFKRILPAWVVTLVILAETWILALISRIIF